VVGLLTAYPELRPLHDEMQKVRDARTERILGRLVAAGLLEGERVKQRLPELRVQVFTQIFFWLPSAILAAPDRDPPTGWSCTPAPRWRCSSRSARRAGGGSSTRSSAAGVKTSIPSRMRHDGVANCEPRPSPAPSLMRS
jgi:hypothetical protein